ncbi:MAG: hypothetical protein ACO214_12840, partial [Hylemonella sp.]
DRIADDAKHPGAASDEINLSHHHMLAPHSCRLKTIEQRYVLVGAEIPTEKRHICQNQTNQRDWRVIRG